MMQQRLFRSAFPNSNDIFLNHFNHAAKNAVTMANLLLEMVNSENDHKDHSNTINRLRANSQEIVRQIFSDSGRALISPFERSDMTALVKAIDSVAGYINISTRRISLYQPAVITPPIKEFGRIDIKNLHRIGKVCKRFREYQDVNAITESINAIKVLEHQADKVYNNAVCRFAD